MGGARIPIVPRQALIRMKTSAGRSQDKEDLDYLRAAARKRAQDAMARLSPDKAALLDQFLKLKPAQRLRHAFKMSAFAYRLGRRSRSVHARTMRRRRLAR